MGTDYVQIFDRQLLDDLRGGDLVSVQARLASRATEVAKYPIDVSFRTQPRTEGDEEWGLCFSKEWIYLDYWGCFAEVFGKAPEGSVSSTTMFPGDGTGDGMFEELFLLLRSEHIDQMLDSLKRHRSEVEVMTDTDIERLCSWRDFCDEHPGFYVAYMYDF